MRRGAKLDEALSTWSEDVARRVSRRTILIRTLKGVAGTVAGLTIGSWVGMSEAEAVGCNCLYPGCGNCSCHGKTCPSNGCPSGCYVCKSGDCVNCDYSDGEWTCCSNCCGICGKGFYLCYDCRCTGCLAQCGCKTNCLCSGCCTPQDVREEMARIAHERQLARS